MFTGLIEEIGTVNSVQTGNVSGRISINSSVVINGTKIGDSIAVNGVCLTVTGIRGNVFEADVMAETFRRSSLGSLNRRSHVNLERAMSAAGRFGGHIVSGHIDGTGEISEIRIEENAIWYTIQAEKDILRYIVEKGSIAIDGISLTVAYVDDVCFRVSIIPHTRQETILQYKAVRDRVNLECDVIGKYVEKLLRPEQPQADFASGGSVTLEFLKDHGF